MFDGSYLSAKIEPIKINVNELFKKLYIIQNQIIHIMFFNKFYKLLKLALTIGIKIFTIYSRKLLFSKVIISKTLNKLN